MVNYSYRPNFSTLTGKKLMDGFVYSVRMKIKEEDMLKLYKIHRTSDEYHLFKNEERNQHVRKCIATNLLKKIQGQERNKILGFESKRLGTESFTGSKIWLERKDTIERRANQTTVMGDYEEDVKFWDLSLEVKVDFCGKCTLLSMESFNDTRETEKLMNNIEDFKKYLFHKYDGL